MFPGCLCKTVKHLGVEKKGPGRKSFIFDIPAAESDPSKGEGAGGREREVFQEENEFSVHCGGVGGEGCLEKTCLLHNEKT